MKKQLAIFLFLLFCPLSGALFAQSKVGHVNTKMVLDTIPSRQKGLKEIQEITRKSEAELMEQDKLLQKAYTDYMGKKGEQSQTVNQYEENRIQKMQQDLQSREQELNDQIQKISMALNENTYGMVKEAVKVVASKKGLQYVIDQDSALFSGGSDVTTEVILEVLRLDALAKNP